MLGMTKRPGPNVFCVYASDVDGMDVMRALDGVEQQLGYRPPARAHPAVPSNSILLVDPDHFGWTPFQIEDD
jgi:hypothetical protein